MAARSASPSLAYLQLDSRSDYESVIEWQNGVPMSHSCVQRRESLSNENAKESSGQRRHPQSKQRPHLSESLKPKQAGNNSLSWRSDPSTSFSDWTLEVTSADGENNVTITELFHCHSNVLVWGPRKSEYLQALFQERMKQVPLSNLSRIELPIAEAVVFPMLLDFMYCETALPLSADRACALYMLADRFKLDMLKGAIQFFIEKGLNFEQSIEFLSIARRQQRREKIERLVLLVNSKLCKYMVKNPKEAAKVPPDLLAHVLHRRAQCMKVLKGEDPRKYSGEWELQRSRLLSVVVAECCHATVQPDAFKHRLSRQTFQRLINPKHLPAMDTQAALKMLQVDTALTKQEDAGVVQTTSEGPADSTAATATAKPKDNKLTSFEDRCLHALTFDWKTIMTGDDKQLTHNLQQLNPKVLAELIVIVSKQYKSDMAKSQQKTTNTHEILSIPHTRQPSP